MDTNKMDTLVIALITLALLVSVFNTVQLRGMSAGMSAMTGQVIRATAVGASGSSSTSGASLSGMAAKIMPTGVPAVYGAELGISFDDVSASNQRKADATIEILGDLDRNNELIGDDLKRYINILYTLNDGISCEYCCGARAVIFSNGQPACGCAHSFAMRGLAKYLILKHGTEFTDEQILEEVGKWKVLFFPGQLTAKAQVLESQGVELSYINLASNKYRGAEKGKTSSSSMVGGC